MTRRRHDLVSMLLVASAGCVVTALVVVAAGRSGAPDGGGRTSTLLVKEFRLAASPVAVTATEDGIWVVVETEHQRAALWKLDPQSGRRLASYTVGKAGPDFGAVTSDHEFVYAAAGRHLLRVHLRGHARIVRDRLSGEAAAVTATPSGVWVATVGSRDALTRFARPTLARQASISLDVQPVAVQSRSGSVWMASTGGLWKVESDHPVPAPTPNALPVGLAATQQGLWILHQYPQATLVDQRGTLRKRIPLPFAPGSFAVTTNEIWVTNNCGCNTGKIAIVNLATRQTRTVTIGRTPVAVTATSHTAWVASFGDQTLWRISQPK